MIETKRIKMYPASREQMEEIIALEPCEELKVAYSEMLEGCLQHIDEWEWYENKKGAVPCKQRSGSAENNVCAGDA